MPSLSALGKFKSSFHGIANEKADIESKEIPFDDLQLPKKEAPPFKFDRKDAALGPSPSSGMDAGGADSGLDGGADFDIGSFMDSLPEDNMPPVETPAGDALSALDDFLKDINSPSSEPEPEPEDTSLNDLLSGFSDEMESAPSDFPEEESVKEDFDAQDFGTEDFGTEDFGADDLGAGDSGIEDFGADDLGAGDSGTENFNTEDFGIDDFNDGDSFSESVPESEPEPDMGLEPPPTDEGASFEDAEDDFESGIDMGGESRYAGPAEPDASEQSDDFDLGSDDFDMSASTETFDAGSEEPSGDSSGDLADFEGGIDLGGESPDFVPGAGSGGSDDFSMDGIVEDFQTEPSSAGDSQADNFQSDDLSLGTDFDSSLSDTDFSASDDNAGSADTLGDFGDDFASSSIDLDTSSAESHAPDASGDDFGSHDFGGEAFGSDDFSLSGLDDILNKSKTPTFSAPAPKKRFFGRKKEKVEEVPDAEDDVEEISLSQDDVDRLLRTLSSYPLNLRVACGELIAEQVILPQQLSKLIRLLVNGAHVKETAAHVESITGKAIIIPKSFEKGTGAAFEAEQSSFAYIFMHNFLPVFRLFAIIAVLGVSVVYLGYNFVYIPIKAEGLYKRGYERIPAGEYQRANELFQDAFKLHRKKKWFYAYAEAFRDQRRYMLAEGKYDELLRFYPRDKKGIMDYANLNTYYLMNYEKANRLLQRELLDFSPDDFAGLLAAGDNFLAWADSNPSRFYDRYEDARFSYARLLEKYGWQAPIVERMMKYFIRTDNLKETLRLRAWFEASGRRRLSADSLAELGGYLLDKQLEKPSGVPDAYVESIESVRDMLLQAVMAEPTLPEPHYHLARYHHNLGNTYDERKTLENAIRAFDLARQESVRRRLFRVDAHYRYANLLINSREFFPAEESVVKGIEHYEDFLRRNLITATPQLGQLYALRGDLEYFVKTGNMEAALSYYHTAERYGYAPPEVQYRMGAAYYQLENWRSALEYLFRASADLPLNRRMLFALGNAAYQRGDYFAAQGYYNRLLDILEVQRVRLPVLLPNENAQFLETGERLMMARNNLGVVNEALAAQTGNRQYRSRALAMYAESARAWDAITRNPIARDPVTGAPNPDFMTRMRLTDSPGAPGINLGYLNANNALRPNSGYRPEIFVRIDKDVLEPSRWEELAPFGGR